MLDVRPLDAADPAAMAAWHATYQAADRHGRPHATPFAAEELRPLFLATDLGERVLPFSGYADGVLVCVGRLELPLRDNLHLAGVDVHTHPDQRRRGHGSAMLAHLTRLAQEHSRRTLEANASTPYDGAADGRGHPNADFLLHRGFRHALGDVMRVLDLPADEARLRRLAEEAAPHHAAYALRQFAGPVPEDVVDAFGELIGTLITEAPMGGLELEQERFDADRIRRDEKLLADSGRTKYTTVAVAPDGTLAAYTEIVVAGHDGGRWFQWGTLVRPEHRGHRLGVATKALNLLWLQHERGDGWQLVTYNADVNRHMIAVNEAMGFRPVERMGEFQKQLG
ncbi:MAG: GNAT family N-acetyltransferase [Nocardioidaceae bacterium]